jgi:hypothetical protein
MDELSLCFQVCQKRKIKQELSDDKKKYLHLLLTTTVFGTNDSNLSSEDDREKKME